MKTLRRILLAAAAVALLVIAAVGVSLLRSVPPLGGSETLPGLSADVRVLWDSLAIPHITASSDVDAVMALGYLHARDRLWGMEVLRRVAEGRLSEVLGPATIETDRYLRSLDIPHAADAALTLPAPETRALIDAYVRGINRWIESPSRPLPPEFRILRFAPEPWTARQAIELGRLEAWDLAASGLELQMARAQTRVGAERVRTLVPQFPDSDVVILPRGAATWRARTGRGAGGRSSERTQARAPGAALSANEIPVVPAQAELLLDWVAMSRASNSWVIGGARTRSGKPILANDPHLGLSAPSLWYLVAIESPGLHVAGATIPGIPVVVLGRNRRIAWGHTNLGVDDLDYVIERVTPDTSSVLTVDGWRPVEMLRDSIRVKGRPAVPFVLRRTAHGPIVGAAPPAGDNTSRGETRVLAMRWNAHDPSDELTALYAVNRAGNWDEFLDGVRGFKSPEENWTYADVDGNIGYTSSGAVPVRRTGNGLLPTPGWTDEGRWERYLDFDELPRAFNPPEGFVVTANNRMIGGEYPHMLAAEWAAPYRARRIRELVLAAHGATADDVRRMQMDTLDLFARDTKDIAARAADAAGRADLAGALRAWDGTMGSDRTEPALFYSWYRALQRVTFDDELGGSWRPGAPVHLGLRSGSSAWFDDITTPAHEDLAAMALRAMREAIPVAAGKRWGDLHRTVSRHALGTVRPLDLLLRLNLGPAPRAGSLYTVNVADFPEAAPPFMNNHAASFRQVVDLAAPEDGMLILTSGQSGNPLSAHYRDQRQRWWRGELWRVPLSASLVRPVAELRLTAR